jgi:hypothetical protein
VSAGTFNQNARASVSSMIATGSALSVSESEKNRPAINRTPIVSKQQVVDFRARLRHVRARSSRRRPRTSSRTARPAG